MSDGTTGNAPPATAPAKPLEQLFGELRPKLHRYCARMTGSVSDGEDVVQETLLKALQAQAPSEPLSNPEGWLFRIAHNAALDFLRRRARDQERQSEEDPDMLATATSVIDSRQAVAASLRTFMQLPVAQRSSVILSDVLGHSLQETSEIVDGNLAAVKSALQRGRQRLRTLAADAGEAPQPALDAAQRERLTAYVERFNAHDFDAVRAMLAEDVQLEVVNRVRRDSKGAIPYFTNYAARPHWQLHPGFVDGRPAALVFDGDDPDRQIKYFVLLDWSGDKVIGIRDFVSARYVMEGATISLLAAG
jgi:RNA polymerase sigma-70 factor (ECF subfamily)